MTTTSNLIEQLRAMVALTNETPRIPALPRALATEAADRLSEMEAENKRLREALTFAAAALHHLYSNIAEFGAVTDGEFLDGIHAAEQRARAALEHQQKGEEP